VAAATTIKLERVSKAFGETQALSDCDFEAVAGEVHAIVGENGSGKSTLAKIISGVLSPDSGRVETLGGEVRSPGEAIDRGLAMIYQEVLVADDATVLENLYAGRDGLLFSRSSDKARRQEAAALLRRFTGGKVDLNAMVGRLPLSLKQWIVIARGILRRPKVLVLDESSAALDLDATQRLHAEIERLKSGGVTVLLVTHRIAELVRIADRATILRDGEAVGVLKKEEITEARLLDVMSAARRATPGASGKTPVRTLGAPIMQASGIRLAPDCDAFDFALPKGGIVGLAGLDGAGQDAFARILAGVARPLSGGVAVIGPDGTSRDLTHLDHAEREGVAWVSGDRAREGIFPLQSIFENFAIGLYKQNLKPFGRIDKAKTGRLFTREVERLNIKTGSKFNRITSLSGGNQQKILIGRALAQAPRIIVLNDPARGVDIATKRDLYRELTTFAEAGGSVVYLSSEIEEFLGFADRVDVFFRGALFRSLEAEQIGEDAMLAAMFGQPFGAHVELDAAEGTGA